MAVPADSLLLLQDNLDLSPGQGEQHPQAVEMAQSVHHSCEVMCVHPQGMLRAERLDLRIFGGVFQSGWVGDCGTGSEGRGSSSAGLCLPVPGEQSRGAGRGAYK